MSRDLVLTAAALRTAIDHGERITAVVPLTTGFSNETYRVEGLDLILRLPPAAGAMLDGHDVVTQARIYAALRDVTGAPPVPGIIAIEESGLVLGVPFFAMERVAGASIDDLDTPAWLLDGAEDARARVCRDWVTAFASLGRLSPLVVLGAPVSPADDARRWRAFAEAADHLVLAGLFDRLLAVPAPASGAPAVVHGDPKLSNLMWQDGRITAVLDWEMALNGDPLADLGYMLSFFASDHHGAARAQKLAGMLGRDEVIALWATVTGRSPDGVEWHEIAQIGKISAILAEGTNMRTTGRSDDPKLAQFAAVLGHYTGVMTAMLDAAGY